MKIQADEKQSAIEKRIMTGGAPFSPAFSPVGDVGRVRQPLSPLRDDIVRIVRGRGGRGEAHGDRAAHDGHAADRGHRGAGNGVRHSVIFDAALTLFGRPNDQKMNFISAAVVIVFGTLASTHALSIGHLSVEQLEGVQHGVTAAAPRFGWTLGSAARGVSQAAYQPVMILQRTFVD